MFTAIWLVENRRCLAVCSGWNIGMASLTTAALTFGAEFDLRNVLEGKWPKSSVSIALAAILLYGSQRQHLEARKGLFRFTASARASLNFLSIDCPRCRKSKKKKAKLKHPKKCKSKVGDRSISYATRGYHVHSVSVDSTYKSTLLLPSDGLQFIENLCSRTIGLNMSLDRYASARIGPASQHMSASRRSVNEK